MIVTRFAPSPTGALHLGHAYAALTAEAAAREAGGRFLLRIEDIDRTRCRPAFVAGLLADLAWLGLRWEQPVRVQSEHFAEYQAALDQLAARGLLYPCFCTRKDIAAAATAPHGPEGLIYPGICRGLSATERAERIATGQPYALRLDMGAACRAVGALVWHDRLAGAVTARPERFGDVVLARKDCPASYHLAVTFDDAGQGVTLVTRGEDLFAATDLHRLLQALFGWPVPEYAHHPLLRGPDGRRLAKRDGARTLWSLREAGYGPGEVRQMAGAH